MEKKVKGSLFKLMVKAVRANKSGIYDTLLSDEAKRITEQRILDSIWYPYEVYRNIHDAVVKVDGKNNPKILVEWGKRFGEALMTSIYKNTMVDRDIEILLDKYQRFHPLVFNWGEFKAKLTSDNQIKIIYENFQKDWQDVYYIAIGWVLRFMELCIGKKIEYKIIKKSWEGDDSTEFILFWSS
ncbi:MAG: hypothetical protein ACFFBP_03370 [Promethearchaeota archaeon]